MDKYRENKIDWNCDCRMLVPLWFGTLKISGNIFFLGGQGVYRLFLSYENNSRKCRTTAESAEQLQEVQTQLQEVQNTDMNVK
jgi:hypothetical protein